MIIPLAEAICCRKWIVPASGRYGKCGLCGTKPVPIAMLPESEWLDTDKKGAAA